MPHTDLITKTEEFVVATLGQDATGHDWHHTDRVRKMSLDIAAFEGGDPALIEIAALLHDIADHKFHAGDLELGASVARDWLESQTAPPELVDHVCKIISGVSFKGAGVPTPMSTIEGEIVQDADRLDALGAIGIARTFAYGGSRGHAMYDPELKPRFHESAQEYISDKGSSINHFHEKLLLLRDRMNTHTARQMAQERHAFMVEYLDRFMAEWDGDH